MTSQLNNQQSIMRGKMTKKTYPANLIILKRFVCEITHEADEEDTLGRQKAVKAWHNRLANGSVPRKIFKKIGKHLFVDLEAFKEWIQNQYTEDKLCMPITNLKLITGTMN